MPRWCWWEKATGDDEHQIRELLRAIWDLHAMYGTEAPWLWRGQANAEFGVEPGVHTRVRSRGNLDDANVKAVTAELIASARTALLDVHEGARLPDMALLALLQHHGAATPLLDVSLDPIVGLYMAVVSPASADDEKDGALFAIKKPASSIGAFDSRTFGVIYDALPPAAVAFYSAPDVSERLRIQRGHFVVGEVSAADERISVPLSAEAIDADPSWIRARMTARGEAGAPPAARTDVTVFRVKAKFKGAIKEWLEARSGLTRDFVYPTPWHRPHLDRFATSHGRRPGF